MSERVAKQCQVGEEYRITRLLANNHQVRNRLIASGLIPGVVIKVMFRLFRGNYWVIQVHGHRIGMRVAELEQLKLYHVDSY